MTLFAIMIIPALMFLTALVGMSIMNHELICPVAESEADGFGGIGAPSEPMNVTITGYILETCTLAWEEPVYDGGVPITDYFVQYRRRREGGGAGEGRWLAGAQVAGDVLTATITDLPDVNYQFRVIANNAYGPGDPSEPVWIETPTAPRKLKVVEISKASSSVELEFLPPASDGGKPVIFYILEYRPRGEQAWRFGYQVLGNMQRIKQREMEDLDRVFYEYRLYAINMVGMSDPSNVAYAEKPSAPRDLEIVRRGDDFAQLAWKLPTSTGFTDISRYYVYKRLRNKRRREQEGWTYVSEVPGRHNTTTLTHLERGDLEFTVAAANVAGYSNVSNVAYVEKPNPPRNLSVTTVGAEHVSLTWRAPVPLQHAHVSEYMIQYRNKALKGSWSDGVRTPAGGELAATQTGLRRGVVFEYRVVAVSNAGNSEPSNVVSIEKPSPPRNLRITNMKLNQSRMTLEWDVPESDGGSTIKEYTIQCKNKYKDEKWLLVGVLKNMEKLSLEVRVSGIKSITYVCRAGAINMAGESKFSNIASVERPGPPRNLRVKKINEDEHTAVLEWEEPVGGNDTNITGYVVEFIDRRQEGRWNYQEVNANVSGNLITATVEGIENGITYNFRVKAGNLAGYGNASNTDFIEKPSPPKNLFVKDIQVAINGSVRLGWEEPDFDGGRNVTSYVIKYKNKFKDEVWKSRNAKALAKKMDIGIPDLNVQDVIYEFKVSAVNDAGRGNDSNIVSVDKPSAPENIKIEDMNPDRNITKISFSEPKENGGSNITSYIIEYRIMDSMNSIRMYKDDKWHEGVTIPHVPGQNMTATQDNLNLNEYMYEFRVKSVNIAGAGPPSEAVSIKKPSAPERVTIDTMNVDEGTAVLSWIKPRDNGGVQIHAYVIEYQNETDKWIQGVTVPAQELVATQGNLDLERYTYKFSVRAKNMAGVGARSDTVFLEKPSPPLNIKIVGMKNTETAWGSAELSWTLPAVEGSSGRKVKGYVVEYKDQSLNESSWEQRKVPNRNQFRTKVTDLNMKSVTYVFRVRAYNSAGKSKPSEEVWIEKPSPPKNFKIKGMDVSKGFAAFQWEEPDYDGKSKISEYFVEYRVKGDEDSPEWPNQAKADYDRVGAVIEGSVKVRNMSTNIYEYRLKARNMAGFSNGSNTDCVDRPSPPLNVKMVNMYDVEKSLGAAELKWDEPENDGGKKVSHYVIEYALKNRAPVRWTRGARVRGLSGKQDDLPDLQDNTYMFIVRSVNMAGESEPSNVTFAEKPTPPQKFQVKNMSLTHRTAELQWKAPNYTGNTDILRYEIQFSKKHPEVWASVIADGNVLTQTVEKLDIEEGYIYKFKIRAENMAGKSKFTKTISVETPSAPIGLDIIDMDIDAGTATLTWMTPKENGGKPVTGYIVEYRDRRERDAKWIPHRISITSDVITMLQDDLDLQDNSKNYEIRVTAVNMAGKGKPSEPVYVDKPPPPEIIKIKSIKMDTNDIEIEWKKTYEKHGKPVTGYAIEYKDISDSNWTRGFPLIEEDTTFGIVRVPSLKNTTYEYRVRARNMAGFSEPSHPISIKRPGKTTGVQVTGVEPSFVQLKWAAPTDEGGGELTGYAIEYCTEDCQKSTNWKEGKVEIPPNSLEAIQADINLSMKRHFFRVKASNIAGYGEPSNSVSVGVPDPPDKLEVVQMSVEHGSAKLSWRKPKSDGGSDVIGYLIQYRSLGDAVSDADWTDGDQVTADKTTAEQLNLNLEDNTYQFRVLALNMAGRSIASNTDAVRKPSAPLGVTLKSVKSGIATIKWEKPENNGGRSIMSYKIKYRKKDANTDWIEALTESGTKSESKLPKLDFEENVYEFIVTAVNMAGEGAPSKPYSIDKPGAPRDVTITKMERVDTESGSVELSWRPPDGDSPSAVTGYVVQYRDAHRPDSKWNSIDVSNKLLSTRVTKLNLRNYTYVFRVKAVNMAGEGPESSEISIERPPPPKNFKVKNMNENTNCADLEWNKPNDESEPARRTDIRKSAQLTDKNVGSTAHLDQITHYFIQYSIRDKHKMKWQDGEKVLATKNEARQCSLNMAKHVYVFRVRAINIAGLSPHSNEDFVDKPDPPENLKVVSMNVSSKKVELTWDKPASEGSRPVIDYIIETRVKGNKWDINKTVSAHDADLKVTFELELQDNVYEFRAAARNMAGAGNWSNIECVEKPSAPTKFVITAMDESKGSAEFNWEEPDQDQNRGITEYSYIIQYRVSKTGNWTKKPATILSIDQGLVTGSLESGLNLSRYLYYFCVVAVNMAGEGKPSNIDYIEKPFPPVKLQILDISESESTAHLTWSAPVKKVKGDIVGYVIEYKDKNDTGDIWETGPVVKGNDTLQITKDSQEWFDFQDKIDFVNKIYLFRVKAFTFAGTSPPSNVVFIGRPSAPRDFKIVRMDDKSIDFTWLPPKKDGGKDILGYIIQYKNMEDSDDSWTDGVNAGVQLAATQRGVDETHMFRVVARNVLGRGEPSASEWADKPSEPLNFTIINLHLDPINATWTGSLDVQWQEPKEINNKPITEYIIEYTERDQADWQEALKISQGFKPLMKAKVDLNINKIKVDRTYQFRVTARNIAGLGPASEVDFVDKPSPPENLMIKEMDYTKRYADLQWQSPPTEERRPIIHYIVEYRARDGAGSWTPTSPVKVTSKRVTSIKLSEAIYEFRVKCRNMAGYSQYSDVAFLDKPSPPTNLRVVNMSVTKKEAYLKWEKPIQESDDSAKIKEYLIEYRAIGGKVWKAGQRTVVSDAAGEESGTQVDLQLQDTDFEFQVKAVSAAGESPPSNQVRVKKPKPPRNLTITNMVGVETDRGSVELEWREPDSDPDQAEITQYIVRYSKSDALQQREWTDGVKVKGGDRSARQSNLNLKSDSYVFSVVAVNMAGTSRPSDTCSIRRPGRPTELKIMKIDNSEPSAAAATLRWRAPEDTGGAQLTGYLIEYCDVKECALKWDSGTDDILGSSTEGVQAGLNPNVTYAFRVRARNMAGLSIPSESTTAERPDPPKGLKVQKLSEDGAHVILSWMRPERSGGSNITEYVIQYSTDDKLWTDGDRVAVDAVDTPQATVEGRQSLSGLNVTANKYSFRVQAINVAGRSKPSNTDYNSAVLKSTQIRQQNATG